MPSNRRLGALGGNPRWILSALDKPERRSPRERASIPTSTAVSSALATLPIEILASSLFYGLGSGERAVFHLASIVHRVGSGDGYHGADNEEREAHVWTMCFVIGLSW